MKRNKGLLIFLVVCLPISWILMGVSYRLTEDGSSNALASLLLLLSMFMPMIAGIATCKITKEGLRSLQIFPRFHENGKTYIVAVLLGVFISIADYFLIIWVFPDVMQWSDDAMPNMIFMIMLITVMGLLQSFGTLGEEIGWMGYLYPKMEKLCGITLALILTGVIRALWHAVMLFYGVDFKVGMEGFLTLCVSNIMLGSVLVLFTKKSRSVVPATFIHVLTNAVPMAVEGFLVKDEVLYEEKSMAINLVTMISTAVVGVICYVILLKKYPVKKDAK